MSSVVPQIERYLTVAQVAAILQVSTDTVRRLFLRLAKDKILIIGSSRYQTIRIPESALLHVINILKGGTNGGSRNGHR